MLLEKAKELEQRILGMNFHKLPSGGGNSLCFFGSGDDCFKMLQWFRKRGLRMPNAICDSSVERHGSYIDGVQVISFDEALERFNDLEILITSFSFGNEIEKKVQEKISEDKIINIQKYTQILKSDKSEEIKDKIARYKASLRGKNQDKFPLPLPEDMPEEAKCVVGKLKEYREIYQRGEDLQIKVDDYFVSQRNVDFWKDSLGGENLLTEEMMISLKEFFSQESFNGIYKIEEQLVKAEVQPVKGSFGAVANNIGGFRDYLSKQNIPFLYVQLPNKLSNTKVNLYKNVVDEQNPIATCLVNELRNRNISCYDFREVMKREGLDSFEYFYKTSHHWNAELAFMATEGILKELESLSILELDKKKLGLENYKRLTYEQNLLGPYGKITGILYGGLDDFELILPKYETSYSWTAEEKGFFVKGNTVDALCNSVFLGWDYIGLNTYGTNPLESFTKHKIVNYKNHNGKKVVWIFDCFTKAIAHILAPHFSELYFYDLRGSIDKKDLFQCIESVKPDVVVMANWPADIFQRKNTSDVNPDKNYMI